MENSGPKSEPVPGAAKAKPFSKIREGASENEKKVVNGPGVMVRPRPTSQARLLLPSDAFDSLEMYGGESVHELLHWIDYRGVDLS